MLTQDVIVAVRTLLGRVQLTGNEVPAYNKIMMQLAAAENELRLAVQVPPPLMAVPDEPAEKAA